MSIRTGFPSSGEGKSMFQLANWPRYPSPSWMRPCNYDHQLVLLAMSANQESLQAPYQTSQASVWERPIQLFYIQAVAAVRAEGSCSSVSWPLYICMILSLDSLLLLGSCWLARLCSSWQPALPLCPSRYENHSLFLKAQV